MKGKLFYIMGASGSGKDSVIDYCRSSLVESANTYIAHRYITRAANAGSENHIALSESEFAARQANKMFKFNWQANTLNYGIGIEVEQWLVSGINVIVNGSRGFLASAKGQHSALIPILIEVNAECLRERLTNRGRESAEEIELRLQRHQQLSQNIAVDTLRVDNSGELAEACAQLISIIKANILNH